MADGPFARIGRETIDEAIVRAAVDAPDCGALVMFSGVIRNHDADRSVRSLEYSAHPEAERFLRALLSEEQHRTGLRIAAWHRIGPLDIGEVALAAATAAAHRREAFEAIEHVVERIKHEVPIWKRQHFEHGASEWVGL